MTKRILFICKENAGRSQKMAEGFVRYLAPHIDVISAGTKPGSNPVMVQVMDEIGIDIIQQMPKVLTDRMLDGSVPIGMGCIDEKSYPGLPARGMADWMTPDPKGADIGQTRRIRDEISERVLRLIEELDE